MRMQLRIFRTIIWAVIISAMIGAGMTALKKSEYKICVEKQTEGDGSKCHKLLKRF
jgi:hypothetical protein